MTTHSSKHKTKSSRHNHKKKKQFSTMQILLSLYGFLFLMYFILSFIPMPSGGILNSDGKAFNPFDTDQIVIKLMFILFGFAYYMTWQNKMLAGALMIVSWIGLWAASHFISSPIGNDTDIAILGFPLVIFGALFMAHRWIRKRR
ncbi:MAG: hypothetical protein WCH34_08705 [Bacteroidota bacterium]